MFAILTDKEGNRVEVEILDVAERNLYREAATEQEALILRTFAIESPAPVATPATYQFELEDGSFVEAEAVFCRALPNDKYFLAAFGVVDAEALIAN